MPTEPLGRGHGREQGGTEFHSPLFPTRAKLHRDKSQLSSPKKKEGLSFIHSAVSVSAEWRETKSCATGSVGKQGFASAMLEDKGELYTTNFCESCHKDGAKGKTASSGIVLLVGTDREACWQLALARWASSAKSWRFTRARWSTRRTC